MTAESIKDGGLTGFFGVELGGLIDLFEKTCFGGYVPDEAEWKMVYADYKVQWKKLTKREKTSLELDKNM